MLQFLAKKVTLLLNTFHNCEDHFHFSVSCLEIFSWDISVGGLGNFFKISFFPILIPFLTKLMVEFYHIYLCQLFSCVLLFNLCKIYGQTKSVKPFRINRILSAKLLKLLRLAKVSLIFVIISRLYYYLFLIL